MSNSKKDTSGIDPAQLESLKGNAQVTKIAEALQGNGDMIEASSYLKAKSKEPITGDVFDSYAAEAIHKAVMEGLMSPYTGLIAAVALKDRISKSLTEPDSTGYNALALLKATLKLCTLLGVDFDAMAEGVYDKADGEDKMKAETVGDDEGKSESKPTQEVLEVVKWENDFRVGNQPSWIDLQEDEGTGNFFTVTHGAKTRVTNSYPLGAMLEYKSDILAEVTAIKAALIKEEEEAIAKAKEEEGQASKELDEGSDYV